MRAFNAVGMLLGVLLIGPTRAASGQVTILFDGGGDEAGVTTSGTTSFSFKGSSWTGGVVRTEGIPPLYASGRFSYEIQAGAGAVTFTVPVTIVTFFYVHGFGFAAGTATAFDSANAPLAMAASRPATFFGDVNNFVTLAGSAPIARITFAAGVIDNFSFTAESAPSATPTPTATATSPVVTATPTAMASPAPGVCIGDCNEDRTVTVDELITGVNIALGTAAIGDCRQFDANGDNRVTIDELLAAVNAALEGCSAVPGP